MPHYKSFDWNLENTLVVNDALFYCRYKEHFLNNALETPHDNRNSMEATKHVLTSSKLINVPALTF